MSSPSLSSKLTVLSHARSNGLINDSEFTEARQLALQTLSPSKRSFEVGCSLEEQGQHEAALEHFRRAVVNQPTNPEVFYRLGECLISIVEARQVASSPTSNDLVDLEAAAGALKRASSLDPTHEIARSAVDHLEAIRAVTFQRLENERSSQVKKPPPTPGKKQVEKKI